MQEKRTLYLAGKITGDPYYFTKFYNAQKKLEEGGFIVVNPALLPAEGFTWEAYMRMSGAMLAECAEVCFLPDWKESKGAKYEFGKAMAQNKPFFFFADWEREGSQNAEKQNARSDRSARANDAVFVGGYAKREISRIEFALSRPERREQTQGGSGTASGGGRESGRSRSMLARRARAISRALHRA